MDAASPYAGLTDVERLRAALGGQGQAGIANELARQQEALSKAEQAMQRDTVLLDQARAECSSAQVQLDHAVRACRRATSLQSTGSYLQIAGGLMCMSGALFASHFGPAGLVVGLLGIPTIVLSYWMQGRGAGRSIDAQFKHQVATSRVNEARADVASLEGDRAAQKALAEAASAAVEELRKRLVAARQSQPDPNAQVTVEESNVIIGNVRVPRNEG